MRCLTLLLQETGWYGGVGCRSFAGRGEVGVRLEVLAEHKLFTTFNLDRNSFNLIFSCQHITINDKFK